MAAFVLKYALQERSLYYQRSLGFAEHLDSIERHGLTSRPELILALFPDRVRLSLRHHFSSGHMWTTEPGQEILCCSTREPDALRPYLDPSVVLAFLDRPDAFSAPSALGLFQEKTDHGRFLELGGSVSGDGTVPYRVLRLGERVDEIVLDHAFVHPDRIRRLEVLHRFAPPATPEALAVVEEMFGPHLAGAVRHYDALRKARS